MEKHKLKCKNCGERANVVEICPDANDEYFCSQECIDKINSKEGRAYRLLGVFALNDDGSTGKRLSRQETTYDDDLKLLAKFKPSLLLRIGWWMTGKADSLASQGDLQYNLDKIHKPNPDEIDFLKAYYAKRELDRRARNQKKFIEGLKKK